MKVSHSIVLVPVILAGLAREGVCQVAADPFEPAVTEENTDANEPGPVGRTRVLVAAPTPPQVKTWYGGKILAADAAMVATLVVAVGTKSTPIAAIGGISYFVTPAVIHGVHGRGGLSVLSVVLRIALPIAGVAMGASMANCHASSSYGEDDNAFCGVGEAIVGGVFGVIAASAVDASLAWEPATNGPSQVQPKPRITAPPRISLGSPAVVPIANGASILLGGRF